MEKKSRLWLWILVCVLGVGIVIGGAFSVGTWLGKRPGLIEYAKEHGVFRAIREESKGKDDLETELVVGVLEWDERNSLIDFTHEKQRGKFNIDFRETRVILMLPDSEGNMEVDYSLQSTLSPYWKNAFCLGDTLVMELKDSAVDLKSDLEKLESKDVVKIINIGPGRCREED